MTDDTITLPAVGEILLEEFLTPLGITPYRLSKDLGVSASSILDLVHGKRRVTVEMALCLAKYFGTSNLSRRRQHLIPVLNGNPHNLPALANGITYNWHHGGGGKGCSGYVPTAKADESVYSIGNFSHAGNKAGFF